jgi:hypothetical protein
MVQATHVHTIKDINQSQFYAGITYSPNFYCFALVNYKYKMFNQQKPAFKFVIKSKIEQEKIKESTDSKQEKKNDKATAAVAAAAAAATAIVASEEKKRKRSDKDTTAAPIATKKVKI